MRTPAAGRCGMTLPIAIEIIAALTMLWNAFSTDCRTILSRFTTNFMPAVLAAALGFFSLAKFMGWPV